jgi:hypothetical protein
MRFSIRDLLWATVVVAMGLGWWMSYRAVDAKRLEAVGQAHRHRYVLRHAKALSDRHAKTITTLIDSTGAALSEQTTLPPDWSVLDEPLVEP